MSECRCALTGGLDVGSSGESRSVASSGAGLLAIALARKRMGVSLREASRLAGVAAGTWRRWEAGLPVRRPAELAMRATARRWLPAGELDRVLLIRALPLLSDECVAALVVLAESAAL